MVRKFLYRKIVTWVTFYMYPTAFLGYLANGSFVRGESQSFGRGARSTALDGIFNSRVLL
jgi:hypothetical protein